MNKVYELRKSIGMQQKELAAAIGVTQPTISEWEHGKKDPSGERLDRLAELFGVSRNEILCLSVPAAQTDDDRELWELREAVRRDPDRQTLFHLARDATSQDVRQAIAILDALRRTNGDDD